MCDPPHRLLRLGRATSGFGLPAAHGEHRHGKPEPGGEQCRVVGRVPRAVAVVRESRPQRARLRIRSQVLVDRRCVDGASPPREFSIEPSEISPFAAGDQRLGQVGCEMKGVVPAPAALREVSGAGDHDVDDRHRQHRLWMPRAEREGDRPAPVMAHAVPSLETEMFREEPEDVVRHGALVVAFERPRRIAESAQIGGDDRMALREPRHHVAPLVPGLRPAVKEHDGRSFGETGAGRDVMNRHLAQIREVVLELVGVHWLQVSLKTKVSSGSAGGRGAACNSVWNRAGDWVDVRHRSPGAGLYAPDSRSRLDCDKWTRRRSRTARCVPGGSGRPVGWRGGDRLFALPASRASRASVRTASVANRSRIMP